MSRRRSRRPGAWIAPPAPSLFSCALPSQFSFPTSSLAAREVPAWRATANRDHRVRDAGAARGGRSLADSIARARGAAAAHPCRARDGAGARRFEHAVKRGAIAGQGALVSDAPRAPSHARRSWPGGRSERTQARVERGARTHREARAARARRRRDAPRVERAAPSLDAVTAGATSPRSATRCARPAPGRDQYPTAGHLFGSAFAAPPRGRIAVAAAARSRWRRARAARRSHG